MTQPLAIRGGKPAFGPGEFGRQLPSDALTQVFADLADSKEWTKYSGENSERLMETLKQAFGRQHVRLTSSGTVAVEVALKAVGVQAGDEVWLAAYDFPGNFRAIEAIGARPCLLELAADRWGIDSGLFEEILKTRTQRPGAILVSHLHGDLAAMDRVVTIAESFGVPVIEDACQNPGAKIAGRPAGGWGAVSVLSFGGSKLLTAGRGGAVLCNDPACAQRAAVYVDRGNDAFPLSELQAAVLRPQLEELEKETIRRANAWQQLRAKTSAIHDLLRPVSSLDSAGADSTGLPDASRQAFYKVGWMVCPTDGSDANRSRSKYVAALQAEGLPVGEGFRGFNKRSARRCEPLSELVVAAQAAKRTILLDHTALDLGLVDRVANAMEKVVAGLD